jgi:hypothetical protein
VLLAWSMYSVDGQIPNEVLNTRRFIVSGSVGELRCYLFGMATAVLITAEVVSGTKNSTLPFLISSDP